MLTPLHLIPLSFLARHIQISNLSLLIRGVIKGIEGRGRYKSGPYPGLTKVGGGGRAGGGRRRRSVDLEESGGCSSRKFCINLIEYGVSFCILKYKSLGLNTACWTESQEGGRGSGARGSSDPLDPPGYGPVNYILTQIMTFVQVFLYCTFFVSYDYELAVKGLDKVSSEEPLL